MGQRRRHLEQWWWVERWRMGRCLRHLELLLEWWWLGQQQRRSGSSGWEVASCITEEDKRRKGEGPVSYYKSFAAVKLEEEEEQ